MIYSSAFRFSALFSVLSFSAPLSVVIASHWSPCKVRRGLKLMSIPMAGSMARVILIWICSIKKEQAQSHVFILVNNYRRRGEHPSTQTARIETARSSAALTYNNMWPSKSFCSRFIRKLHPKPRTERKWSTHFSNAAAWLAFCLFRVIDKRAVSQRIKLELTPLTRTLHPPSCMFMFSRANKHFTESSFVMQMVAWYGN